MEAPAPTLMEASTACVQLASWGTFVTLISMSVRAIHVRMEAPAPTLMEASTACVQLATHGGHL